MGISRVQPGVPSGGRFAARQHKEVDLSLVPEPCSGDPFAFDDEPDWGDLGFSVDEASRWAAAGVSSPDTALRCQDAGLSPHLASHPWVTFDEPGEPPETISIGRAIESGIIDDLDMPTVSAWIRNRTKAHDVVRSQGDAICHARSMRRAGQAELELRRRCVSVPVFVGGPTDCQTD